MKDGRKLFVHYPKKLKWPRIHDADMSSIEARAAAHYITELGMIVPPWAKGWKPKS